MEVSNHQYQIMADQLLESQTPTRKRSIDMLNDVIQPKQEAIKPLIVGDLLLNFHHQNTDRSEQQISHEYHESISDQIAPRIVDQKATATISEIIPSKNCSYRSRQSSQVQILHDNF